MTVEKGTYLKTTGEQITAEAKIRMVPGNELLAYVETIIRFKPEVSDGQVITRDFYLVECNKYGIARFWVLENESQIVPEGYISDEKAVRVLAQENVVDAVSELIQGMVQ